MLSSNDQPLFAGPPPSGGPGLPLAPDPSSIVLACYQHRTAPPRAPCMNGILFYIGLGLGLAAACGLRPFLPVLLAGALASAEALGVSFGTGSFHFLQE